MPILEVTGGARAGAVHRGIANGLANCASMAARGGQNANTWSDGSGFRLVA
jgi:hypothetical protein